MTIKLMAAVTFCFSVGLYSGCSTAPQVSNSGAPTPEVTEEPLDIFQGKSEIRDLKTYRDSVHFFSVMFPSDWEHVAVENPETRISLTNKNVDGSLNAGFNVVVDNDPSMGDLSPERRADHLKRYINNGVVDLRSAINAPVKVIRTGDVTFGGQSGRYGLFEVDTGGTMKVLRFLQMAAYRDGRTYGLTFSCQSDNYDAVLPLIKQIASSFTIVSPPEGPGS